MDLGFGRETACAHSWATGGYPRLGYNLPALDIPKKKKLLRIMRRSLAILAIFTAVSKDVNGIKLNVDHQTLGKRQSTDACIATCNQYQTVTANCYTLAASGGYAGCICATPAVQALSDCVNCGVQYSSSQADINTIESAVNTYISACATLGYPVSIPVTTQPTVSFPCTIDLSTANTRQATVTVTTGAPPARTTTPFVIPTGFSIDRGQLSLLSSLLGGLSAVAKVDTQ